MKVVFALVVLLHLCHSNENNKEYEEIINGLKELDPASISLQTVLVPKFDITDPSSCVSFYVNALKSLLGNVTVNQSNEHIIQGLQATLQILNPKGQHNCTMTTSLVIKRHFKPYIHFFRKLISKK